MTHFKNRKTTRLAHWDYAQNGYYFITICAKNKEEYFGKIIDGEMYLSDVGKIAKYYWYEIPKHFDFVRLEAFVVMPNHIHGIVIIDDGMNLDKNVDLDVDKAMPLSLRDAHQFVGTTALPCPPFAAHCPPATSSNKINRFQNQGKGTISSIIGSYKSIVTKKAREVSAFSWQSRFYDNIIRNEKAYEKIVNYVENNPKKWEEDMFYIS